MENHSGTNWSRRAGPQEAAEREAAEHRAGRRAQSAQEWEAAEIQRAANWQLAQRWIARCGPLLAMILLALLLFTGVGNLLDRWRRDPGWQPVVLACLVALPAVGYGVFSQRALFKYLGIGAAFFILVGFAMERLIAAAVSAGTGKGTATQIWCWLCIVGTAGAGAGTIWLSRLEYARLRPWVLGNGRVWQAERPKEALLPEEAAAAAARQPKTLRPLAGRQLVIYNVLATTPTVAGAFWFLAMVTYRYAALDAYIPYLAAFLAYGLVSVPSALTPWKRVRSFRMVILGADAFAGFALMIALWVVIRQMVDDTHGYAAQVQTTFGMNDPSLVVFTLWILTLILAVAVCMAAAIRLLWEELTKARAELTPRPLPPPAERADKRDEEVTPNNDWDEARPGR